MFALIRFLRMPLAFLVVLIHVCVPEAWCTPWEWSIVDFLRFHFLCPLAVPLFFFFSGFLFFREQTLTGTDYFKKLKSRTRTLLVPYLIFSLLGAGYIWTVKTFHLSRAEGNPYDEIHSIWDFGVFILKDAGGVGPLWFLRHLFVLSVLSPVVFYGLKKAGKWVMLGLAMWLIWDGATIYSVSLFFWTMGAFFALSGLGMFENFYPRWLFAIYLLVCGAEFFWRGNHSCLHALGLIFGILACVSCVRTIPSLEKFKLVRRISELPDASYFVYLTHFFLVGIGVRLYGYILPHSGGIIAFFCIGGGYICSASGVLFFSKKYARTGYNYL